MTILVRLGDIIFGNAEVPEIVNSGGGQFIAVHKMIGGLRTVDSMGKDDDDITFRGWFRGRLSLERVRYLDSVRDSGKQIPFSYSVYSYTVVVKSFKPLMRMAYQVEYEMVLTVVQDLTKPVTIALPISFSDTLLALYAEALDLAQFINAGGILGALGALSVAMDAVDNLNNATVSELASITGAITNSIAQVDSLINSLG